MTLSHLFRFAMRWAIHTPIQRLVNEASVGCIVVDLVGPCGAIVEFNVENHRVAVAIGPQEEVLVYIMGT